MQEPNQRKELTDRVMSNLRYIGNIVGSSFAHPFENTEIDRNSGRVTGHYEAENEINARSYNLLHLLKTMYLIAKESILHPTGTSYLNLETLEVTRK